MCITLSLYAFKHIYVTEYTVSHPNTTARASPIRGTTMQGFFFINFTILSMQSKQLMNTGAWVKVIINY